MPNLGYVSILNINGNELSIKDDALTEVVNEIIEAIGQNNEDISEHINDLNDKSFDRLIKITSVNESELLNIQDGLYKLQYIITSGEEPNITETLTNSAILIQSNDSQYILKNGDILSRSKENSIWSNWVSLINLSLSSNYSMSSDTNNDLELEGGDTFEEAFSKIEKRIDDNELVAAAALTDLDTRINGISIPVIPVTSVNGQTGAVTVDIPVTSVNGQTGAVIIDTPVTSVNGQTGAVTVDVPVISVNGSTGAVNINALPVVTAADNGKILMVVNGQWQLVSPSVLYSGNGIPNNANGNNGDLYMQTD